jgi:hypothetical protein
MFKKYNSNLIPFDGTLVLGLSHKSSNPMVAVWSKGALLNDTDFREHHWPNWNTVDYRPKKLVRNYPKVPGEVQIISKSEMAQSMGIAKLNSNEIGYKLYKDTLIGDVLYITYDTNHACWQESIRLGIIDRKTLIHLDRQQDSVTA